MFISTRHLLLRRFLVTFDNTARTMRITRSVSRAAAAVADVHITEDPATPVPEVPQTSRSTKRKTVGSRAKTIARKKSRTEDTNESEPALAAATLVKSIPRNPTPPVFVPAKLTFSFDDAKQHLIEADTRFEDIFQRLKCRPFEHLERVDPFRTLAHSILGQQISWLAARSITHRFIRLFDPSLPEKPAEHDQIDFFPSAHQVITMDIPTLRTAGLSQRKAEYVLDLAVRFADGRLSTEKLLEADDEGLYEILTAVRGIGRWTVDMFAMFSLRRPDILPVGDLGVQRGVLRWFLSRYAPEFPITISPKKLPKPPSDEKEEQMLPEVSTKTTTAEDASVLPPIPNASVTPAPKRKGKGKAKAKVEEHEDDSDEDANALPTPFTPSINKVLNTTSVVTSGLPPLPQGLTVAALKTRLNSKNKVKGAILTPQEMSDLTEPWRPYRSIGVYYMWALAENST